VLSSYVTPAYINAPEMMAKQRNNKRRRSKTTTGYKKQPGKNSGGS